jgi:hypothetical protein
VELGYPEVVKAFTGIAEDLADLERGETLSERLEAGEGLERTLAPAVQCRCRCDGRGRRGRRRANR